MEIKSVKRFEKLEEAAKRVNLFGTRNISCAGLVNGHPNSVSQRRKKMY
jgi:hypothetical protein